MLGYMERAAGHKNAAAGLAGFNEVFGERQGEMLPGDAPAHVRLRADVLRLDVPPFKRGEGHDARKVISVCQSAPWHGYHIAMHGELCIDVDTREWVALIVVNVAGVHSDHVAAHGYQLRRVLDSLHEAMQTAAANADGDRLRPDEDDQLPALLHLNAVERGVADVVALAAFRSR